MGRYRFESSVSSITRSPWWVAGAVITLVFIVAALWIVYERFRIDVPVRHVAILVKKTGLELTNDQEVAPNEDHKGVQREVLREGRYFYNPYKWDWKIVPQIEVANNELGVRIRLYGDDLPYGQFIAEKESQKGILPNVLRPGRYAINTEIERIEMHKPVTVPAGYKGVVTNLAGQMPDNPNVLLVAADRRGVQEKTLDAETYYVNPYTTRVSLIDCRSQRLNLATEEKDFGFPSKDGFWVSLDGVVEFRVKPEMAAEVFVRYNEDDNGDQIQDEIIRKIILPNARSFCRLEGSNSLGREFIQGSTRTQFQENFQAAMRKACDPLGIEIIQALITRIRPPEQIAKPVRDREIAKQQEKQYVQQILQQDSEIKLAIERQNVQQKTALVQMQQEVIQITIEAQRQQEVAVTKANENLEVARLKLEAAQDQAAAILARGKAAAEVVMFRNKAEAAGWKRAVKAFGGEGSQYARYVMFTKIASAYRNIMVNTADSPIMRIFETFSPPQQQRPRPSSAQ